MNRIQIRQAAIGDENILAQIQVESWRAAYADILPREKLEKHLEQERIEQMYRRVLTGQQLRGSLLLLNDCPHCMAFWGSFRAEQPIPGWAELVCTQPSPKLGQGVRLDDDGASFAADAGGRIWPGGPVGL